ncbi:MAG: phosphoenolpyruvate synthase [Minisyncoccia bacterium]
MKYIRWFKNITIKDVPLVGGKNASLGEMYRSLTKKGVNIPNGFAITAQAYFDFLERGNIKEEIEKLIKNIKPNDIQSLQENSLKIRKLILKTPFFKELEKEIIKAYSLLSKEYQEEYTDVAVRSSATAEDLPSASFAGQHETYLNVRGPEQVLEAVKKSYASLFLARAISYRIEKGFDHLKVGISSGVQKMVRSDLGSSGVMFTLETESGFKDVIVINGIYGLGELIVKGKITPDQFLVFKPTLKKGYPAIIRKDLGRKNFKYVYNKKGGIKQVVVSVKDQNKFCLTDEEILTLAKWGLLIEEHYSKINKRWTPQDIEWAKDGVLNKLFIVQARPETVHSLKKEHFYEEYQINTKKNPVLTGIAIGNQIAFGKVRVIKSLKELPQLQKGEILVTKMTDPDWTSAMSLASAIITDEGSKTCHAAIISRELGIPCIVGTKLATKILKTGQEITLDCSSGLEGKIYSGKIDFKVKKYQLKEIPKLPVKICLNIGAPEIAFQTSFLPNDGVGLAREEFIIAEKIKIHPLALLHFNSLKRIIKGKSKEKIIFNGKTFFRQELQRIVAKIEEMTIEHKDKKEYFVKELAEGIAQIASAFYPKEVIVRFSDFKTNEYKQLIGGEIFEPEEENPMLGWRGASRYYDKRYQSAFELECLAIKRAREVFGLKNINVMVPFCRTPEEGEKVKGIIFKHLKDDSLKIYVMAEIPSNFLLIDEFLNIFDGISIGSNDLTQLILGIDRDNPDLSKIGNENNEAVKKAISLLIKACRKRKKYVGICGQAPSDYLDFAQFLLEEKISAISLNPDSVIKTIFYLAKK